MNDTGLNLAGVGLVAAGVVLGYAGINDPAGGPLAVVRDVLRGGTPTPGVQVTTPPSPSAIEGSGAVGSGAAALTVAQGYIGAPYALGGLGTDVPSPDKGIDCSGLVVRAYAIGAGVAMPHKATLQAARGRRVPRDQAQAGDLVAWGVPGNYPHIALVSDAETCLGAWTWGVRCGYQPIDQKAVPGFGYPDIIRVIEAFQLDRNTSRGD